MDLHGRSCNANPRDMYKEIRSSQCQAEIAAKTLNSDGNDRRSALGRSSCRKLIFSTLFSIPQFLTSNHVPKWWHRAACSRSSSRSRSRSQTQTQPRSQSLSSDLNRPYLFRQITTNCLLPLVVVFLFHFIFFNNFRVRSFFVFFFFRFTSACVYVLLRLSLGIVNSSLSTEGPDARTRCGPSPSPGPSPEPSPGRKIGTKRQGKF